MNDDIDLTHSPLERKITKNGHTIEVQIYRSDDSLWILEVVNAAGTSTVWDDQFPTDQEAFDEVMRTIAEEGIEELAVDRPASNLH